MKVNYIESSTASELGRRDILLLSTLYPKIEKSLSNKGTQIKIVKYINRYRDIHIDALSSPYIIKNLYYGPKDINIIFDNVGVEKEEVQEIIKNIKIPDGSKELSEQITAINVTLMLCIRFLSLQYNKSKSGRDKEILEWFIAYYAYMAYPALYTKYFRQYPPTEEIMKAVMNNMSNKFRLKQTGNLDLTIRSVGEKAIDTYTKRLERCNDSDITYIIQQLRTRLDGIVKKVRNVFKDVTMRNEVVITQKSFDEEDKVIDNGGVLSDVSVYANDAVSKFFATGVNMKLLIFSSNVNDVSVNEMRTTINILCEKGNIQDVQDFYMAIFYLYFSNGNRATDIKSMKFLAIMDSIYKKGNSNDKNIIMVKKLLDKWLTQGSATYRATNRDATMNSFRKGIFWYFIRIASN